MVTNLIYKKSYKATNVIRDKPYNATNIISNKHNNLTKATNVISENCTNIMYNKTEVSLIVPEFTIFVYSSSCNSLIFGLVLSLFSFYFLHSILPWGC